MNSKNYHQKKRFGQHWLVNKKILEKIKEIAVLNENDFILEIGPGKGALTSKLLDSEIKKLHAISKIKSFSLRAAISLIFSNIFLFTNQCCPNLFF